jgi:hypothetical protein
LYILKVKKGRGLRKANICSSRAEGSAHTVVDLDSPSTSQPTRGGISITSVKARHLLAEGREGATRLTLSPLKTWKNGLTTYRPFTNTLSPREAEGGRRADALTTRPMLERHIFKKLSPFTATSWLT